MKKILFFLAISANAFSQSIDSVFVTGSIAKPESLTMVRGPYLQQATPGSIIIKWKTSQATDTKVTYGVSLSAMTQVASDPSGVVDHEIKLTGLQPYTKYYYSVSCSTATLVSSASDVYFRTMPNYGQKGEYRFWAIGDAGTGDNTQRGVRTGFLNYNNNHIVDGWIWLGDNAYNSGFDSEYQSNMFTNNTFENVLKNTVVWPAPGNHDYNNHIPFSPSPAYYDIFSLPSNGECGGLASGTEKYYSYNYGNIHFIVLDSYDENRASNGPMATWLQNDLQANTQQWTIAYFHHPPYTKGSHDSDNPNFLDPELVDIRQNIAPLLEANGVDLVVCGHSHVYERTYLMDGHYGYSNQLQPSMILDNTPGNYPANCPYQKHTQATKSHKGTVYVVCGCSGKNDTSPSSGWPHPAMYKYTNTNFGSMSIDVIDNKLTSQFITNAGTPFDSFTIVKNAGGSATYTVCPNESVVLRSSFPGQVNWFPGNMQSDSMMVSTPVSTVYYATDLAGCVKDTFNIAVILTPACNVGTGINESQESPFRLYPTMLGPGEHSVVVESKNNLPATIRLIDINGKELMNSQQYFDEGSNRVELPPAIGAGFYFIKITTHEYEKTFKLYVE